MSDLPRERIKAIRDGGSSMARRAAVQGWLITLCDMALRTLDAEARNRELEVDNARLLVRELEREAATTPPDSEPAEGEGDGVIHEAAPISPAAWEAAGSVTPPQRRDALEADIKQAASLVERGHTDLAVHVLREGMRALSNPAGEVVVTTNEQGDCLGCQGGSVHHTCGCEPDANPTQQHRDALEACDELDAWLDQLIDFASAAPPSKKRCIERIRRALSTGVPEAFRRTIAFAQEECQEPSVMHVSDMARLIRDYAQAELDRALPQPQEGESDE